jgi:hypothetical protein
MKRGCLPELPLIIDSIDADSLKYYEEDLRQEYEALEPFRLQMMELDITRLQKNLHNTRFQLDTPEGVAAVLGTPKIEAVSSSSNAAHRLS